MANSVDPDQTPRSVASDLGLHCLLGPGCTKDANRNSKQSKADSKQERCFRTPILTSAELSDCKQKIIKNVKY